MATIDSGMEHDVVEFELFFSSSFSSLSLICPLSSVCLSLPLFIIIGPKICITCIVYTLSLCSLSHYVLRNILSESFDLLLFGIGHAMTTTKSPSSPLRSPV